MSGEIICIHVGEAGTRIGLEFWNNLRIEHRLNSDGKFVADEGDPAADADRLEHVRVFFDEVAELRFIPRAVFVDLDPDTQSVVRGSQMGALYRSESLVFGSAGTGNNWAKGYHSDGAALLDAAMDAVRLEVGAADSVQGFLLFHSLGGGTGSGLGARILEALADAYPEALRWTASVVPSPTVSEVVVEPYNATLTLHKLIERADLSFILDNEALYDISRNILKQGTLHYASLNMIAARSLVDATAPLRWDSTANASMRAMTMNLAPFANQRLVALAHLPMDPDDRPSHAEIIEGLSSERHLLANFKHADGKVLAATVHYHGSSLGGRSEQDTTFDFEVGGFPSPILAVDTRNHADGDELSGTLIANTTGIKGVLQRVSAQFAKLYKRKAFLHWYKGEGMEELEFQEADAAVRDLVAEYAAVESALN